MSDRLTAVEPLDPRDRWARQVDGAFVVVVQTPVGRYRRRVFLSIAAAERAAEHALDGGDNAVILLAQLKPLYRLRGHGPWEVP